MPKSTVEDNGTIGLALSAEGRWGVSLLTLAKRESSSRTKRDLVIHNLKTDESRRLNLHLTAPVCVTIAPTGSAVALAGADGSVHELSLQPNSTRKAQPNNIARFHTRRIESLTYSPSGDLLAVVLPNRFILLDRRSNKVHATLSRDETTGRAILAFSLDSKRLLLGTERNVLTLYEVESRATISTFHSCEKRFLSASLSADSATAKIVSMDGTLQTVCLETGAIKRTTQLPRFNSHAHQPIFSVDGALVAVVQNHNTLKVYRTQDAKLVGSVTSPSAAITGIALSKKRRAFACDLLGGLHWCEWGD